MSPFNSTIDQISNSILDWVNTIVTRTPGVLIGLLIGVLIVRVLTHTVRYVLRLTTLQKGLRQILASAIETVLWIMLTIMVLQWLGFPNILVFFSSSTLAIGILLAAGGSTLLSDLIAGIFLARDSDFNVGDEVQLGEKDTKGVIESMDVRRVRVRDEDGKLHVLPNSVIERKEWILLARRAEVVTLSSKAAKAAQQLKAAAAEKTARRRAKKDGDL